MFSQSDYDYFRAKGYTDEDILAIWDRDERRGENPVIHNPAPNVTGLFQSDD